jgi:hypothetical protein
MMAREDCRLIVRGMKGHRRSFDWMNADLGEASYKDQIRSPDRLLPCIVVRVRKTQIRSEE